MPIGISSNKKMKKKLKESGAEMIFENAWEMTKHFT